MIRRMNQLSATADFELRYGNPTRAGIAIIKEQNLKERILKAQEKKKKYFEKSKTR